jgi:hypothetical protein
MEADHSSVNKEIVELPSVVNSDFVGTTFQAPILVSNSSTAACIKLTLDQTRRKASNPLIFGSRQYHRPEVQPLLVTVWLSRALSCWV